MIDELRSRRDREQQRRSAAKALRESLQGGYRSKVGRGVPLAIRDATAYHAETNSWMHPFSDVHKDAVGFFILREDNPDGWRMRVDDLIQDVALNRTPYWKVIANDQERIDLEPIGYNPLLTGVGAGGYVFQASDFKVLTGEYEQERVAKIVERLESGEQLQIYDVKYLLKGTVPLNFGPNGPQGGWYNPSDTYSNRGRGMTGEEIVHADAEMLSRMSFDIPVAALEGEIDVHEWGRFIESPAGRFHDWTEIPPDDVEIFLTRYAAAPWIAAGGRDVDDILEHMRGYLSRVDRTHWAVFAIPGEETATLAELLQHPQEEVQMRGVARTLMALMSTRRMSSEAILDYINTAQGNIGVYDRLLEVAGAYLPSAIAITLLLAGAKLPNGYNRARAFYGLALQRYPRLATFVFQERDAEALKSLASGLLDHGYMPGRDVVQHLLVMFAHLLEDGSVYNRFYAADGIKDLLRLAHKQELNTQEIEAALDAYEAKTRSNPRRSGNPTRQDDAAWLYAIGRIMT